MADRILPENIKELIIWLQPFVEEIKKLNNIMIINDSLHDEHKLKAKEIETKNNSTQKELTEHKNNHWKMTTLIFAGAGIIGTVVGLIIKNI